MAKKDRIQYLLNLLADIISLMVSVVVAWLVTDKVLHVLLDYTRQDWGQFILILLLAFVVVFAGFNGSSKLTRRGWKAEMLLCLQNTVLLGATLAVCLLMTKATLLESRYLYVGILGTNAICLFLSHTALKTYLNKYFYKGSLATLVGIITTSDRAPALIHDLKHDWAKKLQGVVLLDVEKPERWVDGVPVDHRLERPEDMPAEDDLSRRVSADLKKRGFRFVGPVIVYSYLQGAGLINDHLVTCPWHGEGL